MSKITTFITRELNGGEADIDITVKYRIYGKHCRANMEGPEEWPEIEIESVLDKDGKSWNLTESEIEEIYEKAMEPPDPPDRDR